MKRTTFELIAVSAAGIVLFGWPLVAGGSPPAVVGAVVVLASIAIIVTVEATARRLDSRGIALLATIAAVDSALRLVLVTGVGGFSPIFFLVLVAGYVYGPSFGFLCGATSLLASAVVTGGIGPWLPFEAVGCGWVGMVAGIAGSWRRGPIRWRHLVVLGAVGVITGFLYGALLDVWDWTTFYRGTPEFGWTPGLSPSAMAQRYLLFYATTSAWWDTARAAGNLIAIALLGMPVLTALDRMRHRFIVTVLPSQREAGAATGPVTTS